MHNQDNQTITGHRERTILSFRDRLIVYGGVFFNHSDGMGLYALHGMGDG